MLITEYRLFLDTNALLNLQDNAFKESFVIAQKTLEEIEGIKSSSHKDGEVKYKARKVAHLLDENFGNYEVIAFSRDIQQIIDNHYLECTPDNIILATAKWYMDNINPILVCTDDLNCKFIARNIFELETKGIDDINLVKSISEFTGYKDVTLTDEEMSYFYTHTDINQFDNILGEYLIVRKSDGEVVDYRKWNGDEYVVASYKQLTSRFLGKIKPRNPEQVLAFNMLQDKDKTIKILSGGFGTGKDYVMISHALKLIEEGKYEKLVYVRNPIGVKDVGELGFLPGEANDKLLPFVMPLADHLGGTDGLNIKMMEGSIEIQHLGFIRGRDIKNSIIYCTEAENLSKEHVQLLIGRVGEGSALWMNGDYRQTDSPTFRMNNGLMSAIQKLAGHEKFGYVQLQKTERSETAAMADLLD